MKIAPQLLANQALARLKQLNSEGATIIQVTHSEKNAAYGSRIINLLDGGMVD